MDTQEIVTLMNEVGAKLAEPAKHVLEIWLRQIMIFGAVDIAVAIVMLIIAALLGRKILHMTEEDWGRDASGFWSVMGLVVFIFFVAGIGLIIRGSMLLVNPEFWFIKDVLGFVFGG